MGTKLACEPKEDAFVCITRDGSLHLVCLEMRLAGNGLPLVRAWKQSRVVLRYSLSLFRHTVDLHPTSVI